PKETLKAGGAYIVVASGASGGKRAADERLKELHKDAGRLPKHHIRVYTSETLAAWCNCYTAIAARLVGLPEGLGFCQRREWQDNPQFSQRYYPSEQIADQLKTVRRGLAVTARGPCHFHIWGLPGVGKTRLALEVVRAKELSLFTIYLPAYSPGVLSLLER